MIDYFYPEYQLKISGFTITEGVRVDALLDKEMTFDWIIVTFSDNLYKAISVNEDDTVSLSLGYDGQLSEVFTGYVTGIANLRITAKNEMLKLSGIKIVNSFISCVPQDVLTFVLGKAGIGDFDLGGGSYPVKKLYNISDMSGLNAIRDIDRFFELKSSTIVFKCKKFEWNVEPVHSDVNFIYGENIINMDALKHNYWELETALVPGIGVLSKIFVQHPRVSGIFVIDRIKYNINESGFIRVKIQFGRD